MSEWGGPRWYQARDFIRRQLPLPCNQCGEPVLPTDDLAIGHRIARSVRPDLMFEPSNLRAEHRSCSDRTGQAQVIENAKRKALADAGFSPDTDGSKSPALFPSLSLGLRKPLEVRSELDWTPTALEPYAWLSDLLAVPGDASVPLAMTPVHPEATGSYGQHAAEWAQTVGLAPKGLRYWQRLALIRALEHKADGSLCWRTVVLSASRRSGKSLLMRVLACWRLTFGPDLFNEVQTCVHTGSDLQICREVQRGAWPHADAHGWNITKANGKEALETPTGDRWMVRAGEATTGYDVCLGLADECWKVPPTVIDDNLESALLERQSPQLWLVSTSHRRATSLMRSRISAALAADDGKTLLLLWGARPQDDHSDPAVWRAASPHWSEDREETLRTKYAAALAGEGEPELGESPMESFTSQLLNVWRLQDRKMERGDPLLTVDEWDDLKSERADNVPTAAAIESWFSEGVSLALAYGTTVHTTGYPDLPAAVAALKASGYTGTTTVGASLTADPALKGLRVRPGTGRTTAAVQDFARLLAEDALRHTGSEHLTDQVLLVRTQPAADGIRLVSKSRADAIKATVWAVTQARKPSTGKPRILVAN